MIEVQGRSTRPRRRVARAGAPDQAAIAGPRGFACAGPSAAGRGRAVVLGLALALTLAGATGGFAQSPGADGAAPAAEAADANGASPGALMSQPVRDKGRGPVTNLPLPRYVSLKGTEGNARRGPSLSHRIDWVFRHAGLPLRVTAEYGQWRRVEDRDGAGGWVHYSLLSGVRTAIIEQDMTDLHARAEAESAVTARAEQGAIVRLGSCKPDWCQVIGGGTSGWVPKTALWGVDPAEVKD